MNKQTGWKPIPLALKIVAVLLILWIIGSIMNIQNLMTGGLPFFGVFIYGLYAGLVPLLLDIVGPLGFLYALLTRKAWGVAFATFYIGIFVLNSAVALFTVREQLGLMPILVPALVNLVFLGVIYWKRDYLQ